MSMTQLVQPQHSVGWQPGWWQTTARPRKWRLNAGYMSSVPQPADLYSPKSLSLLSITLRLPWTPRSYSQVCSGPAITTTRKEQQHVLLKVRFCFLECAGYEGTNLPFSFTGSMHCAGRAEGLRGWRKGSGRLLRGLLDLPRSAGASDRDWNTLPCPCSVAVLSLSAGRAP